MIEGASTAAKSRGKEAKQGGDMPDTLIERSAKKGLRMTGQRVVIADILEEAKDHPDVEELHARAIARDP
ncbi:transcriptional repressor, partial [Okeania sp. SIO2B9]|uniref:transcriptional repressor n=1 Tax=Okeania sp. SIO2B9 TaxID=2607782 RepID=UPI00257BB90C